MASVKDIYRVGLLSAKRLPKNGVMGKINAAYPETMKPNKDQPEGKTRLVIEINDGEFRIALNHTQATKLAKAYSDDYDMWIDKKVTVKKGRTQFGLDTVDCLEINPIK